MSSVPSTSNIVVNSKDVESKDSGNSTGTNSGNPNLSKAQVSGSFSPPASPNPKRRRTNDQVKEVEVMAVSDEVKAVLAATDLKDEDENSFAMVSCCGLDPARAAIYASIEPDVFAADKVPNLYSISAAASEDPSTVVKEFIVSVEGGAATVITRDCEITCAQLSHSEMIEYRFEDPCPEWKLAPVSQDALQAYIDSKFLAWKKQLDNPSCEAEFRRMLQNGLVSRIYDRVMFITPDALKSKYEVVDEKNNNKIIHLPHPVQELRVWSAAENAGQGGYVSMNPHLKGAPSEAEEASYWEGILKAFRDERGAEYIDGLINGTK